MLLNELFEGAMKRSDPHVSGDHADTKSAILPPKKSTFQVKMENLAKRAKVSVDVAKSAWDSAKSEIDPRLDNSIRWVKVAQRTNQILGI